MLRTEEAESTSRLQDNERCSPSKAATHKNTLRVTWASNYVRVTMKRQNNNDHVLLSKPDICHKNLATIFMY